MYRPETLAALGIDAEIAAIPGNVAAHAVNVCGGGGLVGLGLGWKDQEASTGFLVSIVDRLDELAGELDADDLLADLDDRLTEIADSAVPYQTWQRVMACLELGAHEPDDPGMMPESPSLDSLAGVILYEYASAMAYSLAGLIDEARAEIADEIEGEGK